MNVDSVSVTSLQQMQPAGLLRRVGAMLYDSLLVIAVLAVATLPFLPFLHGKKALVPQEVGWLAYVYRVSMIMVLVMFFGFFWTRRGQTLGMQAWRLRVEDEQGRLISWPLVIRRLFFASLPWVLSILCLSLAEQFKVTTFKWLGIAMLAVGAVGLAMLWIDKQHRTWYDRLARSRVVVLPKI